MYNDPACKPWTSRTWAPAGYSSRFDLVEQTKAAQARKPLASGALEEKQIENASSVDLHNMRGDIGAGASVAEAGLGRKDVKGQQTYAAPSAADGDNLARSETGLTKEGPRGGIGKAEPDGHGNAGPAAP